MTTMSKAKQTVKPKIEAIKDFDVRNLIFPEEFKEYKNNNYITKSLAIKNREGTDEDKTLGLHTKNDKFSFGLKSFGKGDWSFHTFVGPPRATKPNSKEYRNGQKDQKTMLAIHRAIKKRVEKETKDKPFLFLRETEDEENGREYGVYFKVIPNQTKIVIGKQFFTTEQDFQKIENRALIVKSFAVEFGKVSVCPEVTSVKPKLICALAEFAIQEELQDWDIDSIIESEEEEED